MKRIHPILTAAACLALVSGKSYAGYEGPSPLKNIKIEPVITQDVGGLYHYNYKVTNPSVNDGLVVSFSIFIPFDPKYDTTLPTNGLDQCKRFSKHSSAKITGELSIVPVGSAAPNGWSCGYAHFKGYTEGAFSWGAIDDPFVIKPGNFLTGLALVSPGLPGVRDALVEPDVDVNRLPPDYSGNVDKTVALENKVKWTGKTVGPKAPPKLFNASDFISYLITLVNQSRTQGWIDNDGITNSLLAKLNSAASKAASDPKTTINVLGAFINEVQAQSGKHLSSEAYALLFFNAQYAVNHL